MKQNLKKIKRIKRHARVRAKVSGTSSRPRVSVFKSNAHTYVQVIDDVANKTVFGLNDAKLTKADVKSKEGARKQNIAHVIGQKLAEEMKKAGISEAVFDKGGFKYHGRVKAVAEGLRAGGIKI